MPLATHLVSPGDTNLSASTGEVSWGQKHLFKLEYHNLNAGPRNRLLFEHQSCPIYDRAWAGSHRTMIINCEY